MRLLPGPDTKRLLRAYIYKQAYGPEIGNGRVCVVKTCYALLDGLEEVA